ncbi:multicopper oxidase family protein [Armatimonas rosea]|uniref:Spore coat protein A n=1 Tax=Armatimonas rosea TaxID=685828 RepID=A0A7W9W9Q1_ARMRO|nr:multicopper oxidase domain-containing protein [Armatimonas rosea]MBB6054078.1 spore coat protein A [Armatimonas rosea]
MQLTPYKDSLTVPKKLIIKRGKLKIAMVRTRLRLHSELPNTTALWTYEGSAPGPIIEVRRGQKLTVEWKNQLTGTIPLTAARSKQVPGDEDLWHSNVAGIALSSDADEVMITPHIDDLHAHTVVHLHGGKTSPDSDGWTDNVHHLGQTQACVYENDMRSTLLWYHDHAMGVTRFNVFSGLAGFYIIRDADDDKVMSALRASHGLTKKARSPKTPLELPLVIQDRNFLTKANGDLTGELLHIVQDLPLNAAGDKGPMEFFGPYTLVNGTVWPHVDVRPGPYRLRLLNGSNARTYALALVDQNNSPVPNVTMQQIGTDGGLLGAPRPVERIVIAPAERVDLIIDFTSVAAGTKLRFLNTALSPFGNQYVPKPGDTAPSDLLVLPEVMEFRVQGKKCQRLDLPAPLSKFKALTHGDLPHHHNHRLVALVEDTNTFGMLTFLELEKVGPAQTPTPDGMLNLPLDIHPDDPANPLPSVDYRITARMFRDGNPWMVAENATEVWNIINLTGDTHPFHIHLVQFQMLRRTGFDPQNFEYNDGKIANQGPIISKGTSQPLEIGWKDTVRVDPGELVSIAVPFEGFSGQYMYHCHILEHEDHEMMRPFVVMSEETMPFMPSHGHSSGHDHNH